MEEVELELAVEAEADTEAGPEEIAVDDGAAEGENAAVSALGGAKADGTEGAGAEAGAVVTGADDGTAAAEEDEETLSAAETVEADGEAALITEAEAGAAAGVVAGAVSG